MNGPIKRDPESGELRPVGRRGAWLAYLKFWGQVVVLPIVVPSLIAIGAWTLKVEKFMSAGGRCTTEECEEIRLQHATDIAALQLEREQALNDLLDRLPPRHYVEAQETKYNELLRRLDRIERLLEQR